MTWPCCGRCPLRPYAVLLFQRADGIAFIAARVLLWLWISAGVHLFAPLPLICGLPIRVNDWGIPGFPKYFLICALTFAILMVMYEYGIRFTFIGTGLNGKKTRSKPARRDECD